MGGGESKTRTVYKYRSPTPMRPATPPLTTQPWRVTETWTDDLSEQLLREVEKNQTGSSDVRNPCLLLLGPVGAGKSSFINSICSVGKGRLASKVGTGSSTKSFTTKLTRVRGAGVLRNFRLCDTMGVEDAVEEGFHVSDIMNLIEGRIKPSYQFNPRSPIQTTDSAYNQNPKPKDKTHCVIFVVDAQVVASGSFTQNMREKIHELQEQIKEKSIPRVLILTKVDELCKEVDKDIKNLFISTKVEKAVKKASDIFAIPESYIHPVKNYVKDIQIDPLEKVPLLFALRQIVQFATDYLEDDDEDTDGEEEDDQSENDEANETASTGGFEIRKGSRVNEDKRKVMPENMTQYTRKYCGKIRQRGKPSDIRESEAFEEDEITDDRDDEEDTFETRQKRQEHVGKRSVNYKSKGRQKGRYEDALTDEYEILGPYNDTEQVTPGNTRNIEVRMKSLEHKDTRLAHEKDKDELKRRTRDSFEEYITDEDDVSIRHKREIVLDSPGKVGQLVQSIEREDKGDDKGNDTDYGEKLFNQK